jgi:hypothetical protein
MAHLTPAQKATLNTDIGNNAATIPAGQTWTNGFTGVQVRNVPRTNEGRSTIAGWYNQTANPSFTVWKTSVPWGQIGDKINAGELVGLTTGKLTQLQTLSLISPTGINPSVQDRRDAFEQIFSAASGTITRPALTALWKRLSTYAEKLFATGTGSDAAPATLVIEGTIHADDVLETA